MALPYSYRCRACLYAFIEPRNMEERDAPLECPKCHGPAVRDVGQDFKSQAVRAPHDWRKHEDIHKTSLIAERGHGPWEEYNTPGALDRHADADYWAKE